MATPVVMRRARARRPFAVLAAAPPARNRENVEGEAMSFSQCLRRFGKLAGEARPGGKPSAKKCSARTPRRATPAAAAAYDAPRAPLWDRSEERERIRARLSSPDDGGEEEEGSSRKKRTRTRARRSVALREAMAGLPEHGDGRVRYLVDTFERLLSLSSDPGEQSRSATRRRRKKKKMPETRKTGSSWPPPTTTRADEIDVSYPSIASSSEVSFPFNGVVLRRSIARDEPPRRHKRCSSICSSERSWSRKKIGVTIQRPFNLRTERRGKLKEESLVQRMKNKLLEEERLRNPVAQGLPWTTDVPENPVKPLGKEPTEPIDVVLHSEIRAVGRARFDHQVAERNSFLEKLNMERERQQKLDEELEIKQLRKEQVPRAHPMPDFSKPFVPKRSVKPQTEKRGAASHGDYDEQDRRVKGAEVFVGGLPRSVTERALREVFSPCGEIVDLRIMKDQNGISKLQGKRLAVDLSLDQDTLFFGNLCKDWGIEEFEELIHKAAARVLRIGSRTDFLLGGLHPSINWAEKESPVDEDEMAKVKTAFVGNLPANVTEEYLRKLFEHCGEVVRVAVSRKGQYPVGFVHFASRTELDNAIKEMDGETVSVARPVVENDKKRIREEVKTRRSNVSRDKPDHSYGRRGHDSYDRQAKAPRLYNEVSDTDPYEAAVVSLPSAVKELLLRILRLRIGTRYDIDIHCIRSLNELPEKAAVAVLNQFLISGADKHNKGDYFASLIAKYQAETFSSALRLQGSTYLPRNPEIQNKRFPHQDYEYTASGSSRYSSLGDYPSSSYVDDPASSQSRNRRYDEYRPDLVRYPDSRSRQEEIVRIERYPEPRLAHEPRQDTGRHLDLGYVQERNSNIERSAQVAFSSREGGYLSASRYNTNIVPEFSSRSSAEFSTARQQVRFDPFTGEPYKFDPYTGEPIRPESNPPRSGSLY
uniref:RRM domain-containing protein n=1 Tax=Oryza meridionalis TaxID=40149 RepID=A0A0E0FDF6_9ORYZ